MHSSIFDVPQHPISREQECIARFGRKFGKIGWTIIFGAQGPGNNVLRGRLLCLFHRHNAPPHLLHHQRVIFRQLHKAAIAHQIDATVADVCNGESTIGKASSHQSGAHARGTTVPVGIFQDGLVGFVDGIREHLCSERCIDECGVSGQRLLIAEV